MSVFATWFGTRSFLFIGRKSARRRHALRDALWVYIILRLCRRPARRACITECPWERLILQLSRSSAQRYA